MLTSCIKVCSKAYTSSKTPSASIQLAKDKQLVYLCFVRSFQKKKKKDFLQYSRILSCIVQLKSVLFNLLRVVDLFQKAGSQLCLRFFLTQ